MTTMYLLGIHPLFHQALLFPVGLVTGILAYHLWLLPEPQSMTAYADTNPTSINKVPLNNPESPDHTGPDTPFDQVSLPAGHGEPVTANDVTTERTTEPEQISEDTLTHPALGQFQPVEIRSDTTEIFDHASKDNVVLINQLLTGDWQSRDELINILINLDLHSNEETRDQVHAHAMELALSPLANEREQALTILGLSDGLGSEDTRRRLLDIGWQETEPEVQMALLESMEVTLVPPGDRREIVTLLRETVHTSTHTELKAAAILRLADWQDNQTLLHQTAELALNDHNPDVRSAVVNAIGMKPLTPYTQQLLSNIVFDRSEDATVRQEAADVLSRASLTDDEYARVYAAMLEMDTGF